LRSERRQSGTSSLSSPLRKVLPGCAFADAAMDFFGVRGRALVPVGGNRRRELVESLGALSLAPLENIRGAGQSLRDFGARLAACCSQASGAGPSLYDQPPLLSGTRSGHCAEVGQPFQVEDPPKED
jgi:hypothetical protein